MNPIQVFIVDDHYMVIEGISALLKDEPDIEMTGHASNAGSCLAYLKNKLPDVILMDISLPGRSGVELCLEVKELYPAVFVVGLSTFNQYTYIDNLLKNGASGYLLKNAGKEEIVKAIHTVVRGRTYLSQEAAATLRNAPGNEVPVLTRRELQILRFIADGLTNPEIAEKLFLSVSTVDTHRKSMMRKLNIKNTALLVRYAIENKMI